MQSPITWYGGKYYMADDIIELFPEHQTYVEVFGGGGQVLFKKTRSPVEVYNDVDSGLVNFFKVIRSKSKFEELQRKLKLTLYSREEHQYCCENWQDQECEIEKARMFYVGLMQSFAGEFGGSWAYAKGTSRRNMSAKVSRWLGYIDEKLENSIQRFRTVQVENLDFRDIIPRYDSKDTLFYLDPPYLHETRVYQKGYQNEMSNQDHIELIEILQDIKGKAILSGYDNEIYRDLNWNKKQLGEYAKFSAKTNDGHSKSKAKETIWFNFDEKKEEMTLF